MRDLTEARRSAARSPRRSSNSRRRALDDLAEMFVKRFQKLHRPAKEALDEYHLRHVDQTHRLVAMLHDVLIEQCEAFGAHAVRSAAGVN